MSLETDITNIKQILEKDIFRAATPEEIEQRRKLYPKEKVCIDIYFSEDQENIYRVMKCDDNGHSTQQVSENCKDSGFFINDEALDAWIIDNKDYIEVVKDWREELAT